MSESPLAQLAATPHADRKVGQAYLLLAVSLLLVLIVGAPAQLVSILPGLALTELVCILLPAVLFVRLKGLPVAAGLSWRPISWPTAILSIALGASAWCPAILLYYLSELVLGDNPHEAARAAMFTIDTPYEFMVMLVSFTVLPGLCEETLFRGCLQGVFHRLGTTKAVLLTALLFAAYHLSLWLFLAVLFLGCVLGFIAVRTGSTLGSKLAHASVNGTAVSVGYYLGAEAADPSVALLAALSSIFVVAFALFVLATRAVQPEPPLLATVPAGFSRRGTRVVFAGALAAFVLLAATCFVLFSLLGAHAVASDQLEPDIHRGQRVLFLKAQWVELEIRPGDVVALRENGTAKLRKVVRIQGDDVWIRESQKERKIPRAAITGKVLHVIGGKH